MANREAEYLLKETGVLYRRIYQMVIKDGIAWDVVTGNTLMMLGAGILVQTMSRDVFVELAGQAYDVMMSAITVQGKDTGQ
jgi:hypothetical protein